MTSEVLYCTVNWLHQMTIIYTVLEVSSSVEYFMLFVIFS